MVFKTFGWNGFELKVPKDWDMSIDRGGFDKGYIRLDGLKFPRLEVSWEQYKEDKVKPLNDIVEAAKKHLRKKDKNVRFIGKDRSIRIYRHPARRIRWRIDGDEGYLIIWYCDKSQRLYRLQIFFKQDEYWSFKSVITEILKSFKCHVGGNLYTWTALDFTLKLPKIFRLEQRTYKVGKIALLFESKDSAIFINRIGMANVVLSEKYDDDLRKLLEEEHLPDIRKRFKIPKFKRVRRFSDERHEGFIMTTSYKSGIFMPKEFFVKTRVWTCEPSNKIYAVTMVIRKGSEAEKMRSRLERLLFSICP